MLQNGPDVSVGGVGGQSEYRPGQGVRQGNGSDEGIFGGGESLGTVAMICSQWVWENPK